jgi:hypothetical protein
MTPAVVTKNLSSYQGDGILIAVDVTDLATGAPIDLTGCNVYFTAKRSLSDNESAAVVHVKTGDPTTYATITVTALSGHILLQVHSAATASLALGTTYPLYYDVKVDSGSSTDLQTVQRGVWTVSPAVTTA